MPKFKITTDTVNQYNRKAVVQTKLTYEPITITFHDDMANATTDLWKNYYQYYYADPNVGVKAIGKGSRYALAYELKSDLKELIKDKTGIDVFTEKTEEKNNFFIHDGNLFVAVNV